MADAAEGKVASKLNTEAMKLSQAKVFDNNVLIESIVPVSGTDVYSYTSTRMMIGGTSPKTHVYGRVISIGPKVKKVSVGQLVMCFGEVLYANIEEDQYYYLVSEDSIIMSWAAQ